MKRRTMLMVEGLESRCTPAALTPFPQDRWDASVAGGGTVFYYGPGNQVFSEQLYTGWTGGIGLLKADVTGDGKTDLIFSAEEGGGPRITVKDGESLKTVGDFFGFEPSYRLGVRLAVGDPTGDGKAKILVGAVKGGSPRATLFTETGEAITSFFAGSSANRNGVYVGMTPPDQNGLQRIVTQEPGLPIRVWEHTDVPGLPFVSPQPVVTIDPPVGPPDVPGLNLTPGNYPPIGDPAYLPGIFVG